MAYRIIKNDIPEMENPMLVTNCNGLSEKLVIPSIAKRNIL
jgi:hypothetical protein